MPFSTTTRARKPIWSYQRFPFAVPLFYVNVDTILTPPLRDKYIEIKSRTWAAQDAEQKADRIHEMLGILGIGAEDVVRDEYLELRG